MKTKKLNPDQMQNLEGGISDRLYWALLCSGVSILFGVVTFGLGVAAGLICSIWGPSLDVPPIANPTPIP